MPSQHPVVLDHVALAVPDIGAAADLLVGELGAAPHGAGPGPGYRFWQWRFARGGVLELLQPDGPPGGFVHRFLDSRGPGLHHVTFKVPDIREAMRRATDAGYQIVNANLEFPAWKEAFLHPKQAQGIVVQLAESHPELEPEEWSQEARSFPELPSPAATPLDVVGLRMVARSALRARTLWEQTLLGQPEECDGGLAFRWPESPLRIVVRVDPGAEEGPLGLEIAARPGLHLPEGPHPTLGCAFLPVDA
jgi:methylmalonyl-CoA/ethylmalonyl-CoA epimerase